MHYLFAIKHSTHGLSNHLFYYDWRTEVNQNRGWNQTDYDKQFTKIVTEVILNFILFLYLLFELHPKCKQLLNFNLYSVFYLNFQSSAGNKWQQPSLRTTSLRNHARIWTVIGTCRSLTMAGMPEPWSPMVQHQQVSPISWYSWPTSSSYSTHDFNPNPYRSFHSLAWKSPNFISEATIRIR